MTLRCGIFCIHEKSTCMGSLFWGKFIITSVLISDWFQLLVKIKLQWILSSITLETIGISWLHADSVNEPLLLSLVEYLSGIMREAGCVIVTLFPWQPLFEWQLLLAWSMPPRTDRTSLFFYYLYRSGPQDLSDVPPTCNEHYVVITCRKAIPPFVTIFVTAITKSLRRTCPGFEWCTPCFFVCLQIMQDKPSRYDSIFPAMPSK